MKVRPLVEKERTVLCEEVGMILTPQAADKVAGELALLVKRLADADRELRAQEPKLRIANDV